MGKVQRFKKTLLRMATEDDVKNEIELNNKSQGDDKTISTAEGKLKWWYNAFLVHFGDIDMSKQTYNMTAEIWIYRQLSPNECQQYITDKNYFSPKFRILLNPLGSPHFEKDYWQFNNNKEFVIEHNKDMACYIVKTCTNVKVSFFEGLELESFPFDIQHFQMAFQFRADAAMFDDINNSQNPQPLEFEWVQKKSRFCVRGSRANLIGWILKEIQVRPHIKGDVQCWVVVLRRAWRFYFWRVIVILSIVSLISVSVFVFGGDDSVADRLGFLSTTMLTAVAYMFIINEYLPTLNYLTLLDYYVLFVIVFMFILVAEIVIVELIDVDMEDLDFWMFVCNVSAWFVIQLIFCLMSVRFYNEESKKIKMAKEDVDGYDIYSYPYYEIDFNENQVIEFKIKLGLGWTMLYKF